jgi:hypothetical protein
MASVLHYTSGAIVFAFVLWIDVAVEIHEFHISVATYASGFAAGLVISLA